ncbi:MAG: prephenate dehydrogenase [Solobacterium sp.]|jgi:prephenate dehydrogenase|nr:prephenate dehydrogenase [Solobacterium sp.]MCH4048280.1 prephenate dehydrogenase [Solobacterium sp.]MCH4074867.1 prephenate dehydrogenase [Solobacterium sp.]MCI1314254.1 prephenate dehydrogenase [Solobacterium sp.]MCI1346329.1 prephenate dehydrogenase [Solobacterium sp.]
MISEKSKITIIGLGVLGGSYAKGFAKAGIQAYAVDLNEDALRFAKENHWIKDGSSDPSLVRDSDLVISCLYPHTFIQWVKDNQKYFRPGTLLSDVTGVKRKVISAINDELRQDCEFIACHPMAGRESRGLAYADESRFENANFIIVPTEKNTKEAIDTAYQIARILKFGRVCELSAEEHDRMIGFLSQLTHVIAVSLMNTSDHSHLADYTGDSFRDLTRIANINEDLWPELFVMNKDYLLEEIHAFTHEMESFASLIENEDYEAMRRKLIQSTKRRKQFDK